jgi:hypothetical protein
VKRRLLVPLFTSLLTTMPGQMLGPALAQQSAQDLSSEVGPLRTGRGLTFCLDQQNPAWAFEKDMALALARSLGRPAEFYINRTALGIDDRAQPLDRSEIMRLFAHHCDVYTGLVGSTTPAFDYPADEQMYATRPYLKASYLFVTRDPAISSLAKLPKTAPLSMEGGGLPAYFMYTTRKGQFTDRRVSTAARLASDLVAGKAKQGLIFAPQLYSRVPDLAKAGLKAAPVTELPNMSWYVVLGVRRDRPSLRGQLDAAITRLIQKGEVAALLAKHKLNRSGIQVAAVSDRRPGSESFNNDK